MDHRKAWRIAGNIFELVALFAAPCFAVPGFLLCREIANGSLGPALLTRIQFVGPILLIAAFFWPSGAITLALGYALLAGVHYFAGLELQPVWFRCLAWIFMAVFLALVPLDGLAFFPVGALLADLCINRRPASYLTPRQAAFTSIA